MSGVYIPNFKIPKDGYRQLFLTAEGEIIWYPTSPQNGEIRRQVIPVPDHGRLIDADAIMQHIRDNSRRAFGTDEVPEYSALSIAVDYFDAAPTIIPASEENSNVE